MKKVLNILLISALTITVGFISMAVPFSLLDNLSQLQMRFLLAGEVAVYFVIFSAYFGGREAKAQRRSKDAQLKEQHDARVAKRKEEMNGIVVNSFDLAA